ncbi:MAG: Na+/H+ antiporter NhaA [Phycisphaerae bacterium]
MATSIKRPTRAAASINLLREFSIPLIAGIVFALVWANAAPASYAAVAHGNLRGLNLEFIVNELFMAVFFGIAAVEITDSLSPGGSMHPLSKAVTPLLATAGGVLGPAAVYLLLNALWGQPEFAHGWGIATATDIALAWLVARLVFPKGHPAIAFLLLLAIADDAIGLAIIAIFYPDPAHPVSLPPLALIAAGMAIAAALRRFRIRSYWPYLLAAGSLSWTGLLWAHLHPALALVFIVPFMPHRPNPRHETVFELDEREHSTLSTFEHEWKVIVDFGLFFFGLVNAGVLFSTVGTVTWIIIAALFLGKTAGIFGLGLLSQALGFGLPTGMNRRDLLLVAMTAAIGLTVALFVAGAAFPDGPTRAAAKMGALGSILITPLVLLTKSLLPKQPHPAQNPAKS